MRNITDEEIYSRIDTHIYKYIKKIKNQGEAEKGEKHHEIFTRSG